jgi:hypothetical protein
VLRINGFHQSVECLALFFGVAHLIEQIQAAGNLRLERGFPIRSSEAPDRVCQPIGGARLSMERWT